MSEAANLAVRFAPTCFLDLGIGFEFTANRPFSIEAWGAPSPTVGFGHLFARQVREMGGPVDGYSLLAATSVFRAERAVAAVNQDVDSLPFVTDVFAHTVMTYDGNEIRIYVDGQLANSVVDTRSASPSVATAMIGCSIANASCFDGVIDEVALFDRALPPSAIRSHRDSGTR